MIEIDKIYNEDCLEGMKRIADGAVDCIITDLPYEVLNDGNPNAQWDKMIPLEPLWEQFLRVTKHNAAIVLFAQGMFTAQLMMSQPKMWRYNLIWDKMRATGFLNCHKAFLRQHEDLCVFYRPYGYASVAVVLAKCFGWVRSSYITTKSSSVTAITPVLATMYCGDIVKIRQVNKEKNWFYDNGLNGLYGFFKNQCE